MTQELENLYTLARRARREGNSENAQKYYDMILLQNPNDWEAAFYSVYFQAFQCKIAEIESAANRVRGAGISAMNLIAESSESDDEKYDHAQSILQDIELIAGALSSSAKRHFDGIDNSIAMNYISEYTGRVAATRRMCIEVLDEASKIPDERIRRLTLDSALTIFKGAFKNAGYSNEAIKAERIIQRLDPSSTEVVDLLKEEFEKDFSRLSPTVSDLYVQRLRQLAAAIKRYEPLFHGDSRINSKLAEIQTNREIAAKNAQAKNTGCFVIACIILAIVGLIAIFNIEDIIKFLFV